MSDKKLGCLRPWAKRAEELEPESGHWADYAAWKEWFSAQENKHTIFEESDILGEIGPASDAPLYCMFCDAYDRIGVLTEALKPFAADADGIDPKWDDARRRGTLTGPDFTVGDIRRARAALSSTGGPP